MNLKEELLNNHSLVLMKRIKKYIGNDSEKFNELMKLVFSTDPVLPQRASWAAMHAGEKKIELLEPWLKKMIRHLEKPIHSSVKRNITRLLQDITLPEKYRAEMFDIGMKNMVSANEPVAVKAFSMTVLANIVKLHPELKDEFLMVVSQLLEFDSSPAIQSRGRKILKSLKA